MREAITIEYIVLLMTYSHPAVLVVLHASLRDHLFSFVSGSEE